MAMAWGIFFPGAMLGARYLKAKGGPLYFKVQPAFLPSHCLKRRRKRCCRKRVPAPPFVSGLHR